MTKLNLIGGARIGMTNATWPLAILKVSKNRLDLNIGIIGSLSFKSTDVISIKPYSGFMSNGLKINHKVATYNNKVIFWTFKNPNEVINQIRQIGFLDNKSKGNIEIDNEIIKKQKQGSFPIKISFAIAVVVIWNILFLIDFINFFNKNSNGIPFGNGVEIALGFVFFTFVLILISSRFRKIVLKEGRELKDVKKFLYFIIFITGFLLLNLAVFMNILNILNIFK